MGTAEPTGPSISVSACRDLSQCGGLSSWRQSKLFPAVAGIPAERRKKMKNMINQCVT